MSLSKRTEMQVCRGCLSTDARLYDMRQNRLMEAYSTLLSTIQETDDLPHYLCSYCAVILLKFDTFRTKCIDNQVELKNSEFYSLNPTKEYIKPVPYLYLRQSYIQTIDIDDTNLNNLPETVKEEINDETDNLTENLIDNDNLNSQIKYLLKKILKHDKNGELDHVNDLIKEFEDHLNFEELKSSSTIDKHRIHQLAKIINHIQYSSQTKTDLLEILDGMETTAPIRETNLKLECPVTSDSKQNAVKNEDLHLVNDVDSDKELVNDDLEYTDEINETSSDTEDEIAIADLRINSKPSKCKVTTSNPNIKVKKNCKAIKNGKRNEKTKDKSKLVSKLYNMNEIDLSEEEQLKEIEDRKNSDGYLQATFKCNFCYKGFRIEESFESHMVIHDDKSGKYVCDLCHCHFINITRLKKHRYNHKKRYSCKECTYVTKYVSQAREHYKWHGGVKDTCKHCGKECSGQSNYYIHLKRHHPTSNDLVRCEICGQSCSGPLGFKIHEKRAHKEMTSPECHCSSCDTQFYCSDAFKTHQGTDGLCDTTYKYCVRCGMSFETEQLLKEHEIEQRKPGESGTTFNCEVCNKNIKGHTSFKMHQLQHSLTATRQVICEICGKVLSNQYCLNQHYLNKHSTETPFKCTECPKSFRCAKNLQLHTRTHTGERPYKCKYCQKAFKSCSNMKRHELVHTGERPCSCDICGKSFQTTHNVKAHIKTVHNQIRRPPSIRRRNKKN